MTIKPLPIERRDPPHRHGLVRLLPFFCWMSAIGWGVALGAKSFDLLVLATAWGSDPPSSLSLLPYGRSYPVDPGDFFQPLSAWLLVASVGALVSGWGVSPTLRRWLALPVVMLLVVWVFTPTIFWPMINDLWAVARGRLPMGDATIAALVHRWFVWDAMRTALIGIGFAASLQAMREFPRPPRPAP